MDYEHVYYLGLVLSMTWPDHIDTNTCKAHKGLFLLKYVGVDSAYSTLAPFYQQP